MILQALHRLAEYEELVADPDFELKPVAFLVRVGRGGRLLGIESTAGEPEEGKGKKRPRPKPFPVPREPGRTSGDRAFFLFDKSEYALGLDPTGQRPADKLAARFALFRGRVRDCAEATGDEAVLAVHTLLDDLAASRQQTELPEDCAGNDLFAFVFDVEDRLVTDREAVRRYWKGLRGQDSGAPLVRCLVTGQEGPAADKHSILKFVPGAVSSGVPLVSFNSRAFESYGWSGNENAAVSRDAAEAYATALQRLLHPAPPDPVQPGQTLPRRNLRLAADTAVCYWAADADAESFVSALAPLLESNPEEVRELYRSIWTGHDPALDNPSAFYALTLSGAQGRVVVRGWFESTVSEVARNLALHFADLAIVRNTPKPKERDLPPQLPLHALLQSLAVQGKSENVPPALAGQLVEAALRGTPYPFSILQRAVERARAEIGKTGWADLERRDARAALVKAVLNRRWRRAGSSMKEVRTDMDPSNTQSGYLLGRLMAVIERLQQIALGDVNASVTDRYFSAASAAPRAVFVRLLKGSRHHARKAKDDDGKAKAAHWLEKQLDDLVSRFDPGSGGFPPHLSLEQQGLFVLGYHQQRHWLWQSKAARQAAAEAESVTTET
jgi:CRISPR-associated protein Csd1